MHTAEPNQSLERTPDKQSCFASQVVCGRRSAHRWTLLGTKSKASQMTAFEGRDSSILASSIPVAVGQWDQSARSSFPKVLSALQCGRFRRICHDSPLSFTSAMMGRSSTAPVHGAESNKSLERTPDEQSCFALSVVSGRRSALRWTLLGTESKASQMTAFEGRDSSILANSIPVAVGQWDQRARSSFPKVPSALQCGRFRQICHDSPLSFTSAMLGRSSTAPVSGAESNKSLERTPDKQGCFASLVVCGRRSALR